MNLPVFICLGSPVKHKHEEPYDDSEQEPTIIRLNNRNKHSKYSQEDSERQSQGHRCRKPSQRKSLGKLKEHLLE